MRESEVFFSCAAEVLAVFPPEGEFFPQIGNVHSLAGKWRGDVLETVCKGTFWAVGACWEKMDKQPILRGGDLAGAVKKL